MTIIFQVLAVVAIAVAAFFMLRGGGARHQAIRRVLMLLFIIGAASSVFFPQIWTYAAKLVGVGRGADLLLYFLVLTFIGFVATTYRRFRQLEGDMTELARQLALLSPVASSQPTEAATKAKSKATASKTTKAK
jgi:small membrane protein